jgi:hypothetical protein
LLVLAVVCAASPCSEDIDVVVARLADQDFDKREVATSELGKYPACYARIFMKLAEAYSRTDMEVDWRLRKAVRLIYESKLLPLDPRFRRMLAQEPFVYRAEADIWHKGEPDPSGAGPHNPGGTLGFAVDSVCEGCTTLKPLDFITHIDGTPASKAYEDDYGAFEAGKTHDITARRFKDPKAIGERGYYLDTDEFDVVVVKVTIDRAEFLPVDKESSMEKLRNLGWKEWVEAYREWDRGR